MEKHDSKIKQAIAKILDSQQLAVLATVRDGQPYSSLMAYAHTPDLKTIIVATGTATRKFVNLTHESRVSLLIDTSNNCETDFHAAEALTILGTASPVDSYLAQTFQELYLKRHPYLINFITSPTTAIIKVEVHHYLLVSRFQNVMEYHPGEKQNIFT